MSVAIAQSSQVSLTQAQTKEGFTSLQPTMPSVFPDEVLKIIRSAITVANITRQVWQDSPKELTWTATIVLSDSLKAIVDKITIKCIYDKATLSQGIVPRYFHYLSKEWVEGIVEITFKSIPKEFLQEHNEMVKCAAKHATHSRPDHIPIEHTVVEIQAAAEHYAKELFDIVPRFGLVPLSEETIKKCRSCAFNQLLIDVNENSAVDAVNLKTAIYLLQRIFALFEGHIDEEDNEYGRVAFKIEMIEPYVLGYAFGNIINGNELKAPNLSIFKALIHEVNDFYSLHQLNKSEANMLFLTMGRCLPLGQTHFECLQLLLSEGVALCNSDIPKLLAKPITPWTIPLHKPGSILFLILAQGNNKFLISLKKEIETLRIAAEKNVIKDLSDADYAELMRHIATPKTAPTALTVPRSADSKDGT